MKKRGGQKKHWADVVKVKIWCETLKSQSGLSDYELNKRFAWKPPYKPSSSLDRTWVFEWIRKEGREPQGRDVRWRSMSEIITAVDQVPEFSGIRSVYDSGFWELLKLESISLSDVRAKIQTKLKFHSLKRVDKKYDSDLREAIKQYDEQSVLKVYLELSFENMHGIDALEFCCLLYLESRGAESSVTSLLESIFDNRLNDYFDDHLGSFTDNNYFVLAVNRMRLVNILKTKVDLNRIDKYRRECLMPLIKA